LVTLLKLNPETKLEIRESDFADFQMTNIPTNDTSIRKSKDLLAVRLEKQVRPILK
jgi:hypothetical protein